MPILEGTGQKPRKVRGKSGVQIATPKGPTVRSRVVARETPKKNTAAAMAGLGSLGQALSGFFKQIGPIGDAIAQIEQADSLAEIQQANAVELAKIKQENKDLALTGAAKALKGEKLTDEEANRHASLDAFENTMGQRIGWDLVAKWKLHMVGLPEGVGTQEAWDAFIKSNLQNSTQAAGLGTGNPRVDVAIMAVLERGTSQGRRARQLQRARGEMNKQALSVTANFIAELNDNGAHFNFSNSVAALKRGDPFNAHKAEANVVAAMVAWAGNNRGKGTQIIQIFETEGIDKRMGIIAWNKIVDRIVQNQLTGKTIDGQREYESFMATSIVKLGGINLTQPGEFAREYQRAFMELTRLSHKRGQQSGLYSKALSALTKIATKFGTAYTKMIKVENAIRAVQQGATASVVNVSETRKYFREVMRRANPNGVANPLGEARWLDHYLAASTIDASTKAGYTTSLTKFDAKFGDTMRTLMAFAALNKGNESSVMNLIGAEVHTVYKAAVSDFKLGKTWDEIANRIALEQKEGGKFEHTFKQMVLGSSSVGTLGKKGTESESQTEVMELINDRLKEKFKELDVVKDQTLRTLSRMGLREWAILKQGDGTMTAKRAIELFVEAVIDGGRLTLIPGTGDKMTLGFTRQPKQGDQITVGGGLDVTKPPFVTVGFGESRVSQNRFVENTIETYRLDRDDIAKFAFTGAVTRIGGAITADSISLDANHMAAAPRGLYVIRSNNQPITFEPGQTVIIGGKEITLPKNVVEAVQVLEKLDAFEGTAAKAVVELKKKQAAAEKASPGRATSGREGFLLEGPAKLTHRQKTMNQRIVYLVVGNTILLTYRPGFIENPDKRPLTGKELADLREKKISDREAIRAFDFNAPFEGVR